MVEGEAEDAAGAAAPGGAGLLSTDLSPIAPPQKRSRKLLGGGTSRCKTPKAKKAAAAAASRADDHDENGENAAVPPASPGAAASSAGALPPTRVTGVVTGVGPKSGSSAAVAKRAPPLAPASQARGGAGSGSGTGGGGGDAAAAAKPAVKPLKVTGQQKCRLVGVLRWLGGLAVLGKAGGC